MRNDFAIAGAKLAIISLLTVGCISTDLAPGVNPEAIKKIKLGMTPDSVVHILGLPYAIEADGDLHLIECTNPISPMRFAPSDVSSIETTLDSAYSAPHSCCKAEREARSRRFTMEYSRMAGPWEISPMIWVHMDESHRVHEVYAKVNSRSILREDQFVYLLCTDPFSDTAGYAVHSYDCKEELLSNYFAD